MLVKAVLRRGPFENDLTRSPDPGESLLVIGELHVLVIEDAFDLISKTGNVAHLAGILLDHLESLFLALPINRVDRELDSDASRGPGAANLALAERKIEAFVAADFKFYF